MGTERVRQIEFSRLARVSRAAVCKGIQSGLIFTDESGLIPLDHPQNIAYLESDHTPLTIARARVLAGPPGGRQAEYYEARRRVEALLKRYVAADFAAGYVTALGEVRAGLPDLAAALPLETPEAIRAYVAQEVERRIGAVGERKDLPEYDFWNGGEKLIIFAPGEEIPPARAEEAARRLRDFEQEIPRAAEAGQLIPFDDAVDHFAAACDEVRAPVRLVIEQAEDLAHLAAAEGVEAARERVRELLEVVA